MLPSYDEMLEYAFKELEKVKHMKAERFELPRIDAEIEGNKTIWRNFSQVCEKLRRDKKFVAKYFSKELATQVVIEGERLILFRKLLPEMIKKKLEEFVKEFVLCPVCKRPDTNITEMYGAKVMVCESCGARTPVRLI